jgi:hypothetical protein
MSRGNKFSFLKDTASKEPVVDLPPEPAIEPVVEPSVTEPSSQSTPIKKMGRPKGKRSDPNYEQVTAYIRRDTHTATKIALLQEGKGREFSELIQDLLSEYLRTQKSE